MRHLVLASAALGLLLAVGTVPVTASAAKPALTVATATSTVQQEKPGWSRVSTTVTNSGTTTVKHVVVTVSGKGAKAKPGKVVIAKLAPGAHKTIAVKVKRQATKGTVTVRATAHGAKDVAKISVTRTPPPAANPLVGHGYWHWTYQAFSSEDGYSHLYFVDGAYAYWGLLDAALPGCTSATITTLDPEVPGCIAYSFDAAAGTLAIGGQTASFAANSDLTFADDVTYDRIDYPEAGATADLVLEHIGYSGCSGLPYCSTWTDNLAMNGAGQFVRTESSLTTLDVPGTSYTAAGGYPPSDYGTYAVVARGVVELRFADGHVETKVIGYLVDDAGATAPTSEGVFLADEYYWHDDDE